MSLVASVAMHKIDDITIFTVSGDLSFNDIIDTIRQYYHSVTFHIIWDISDGLLDGITSEQLRRIPPVAKEFLFNRVGGKTAYVCTSDHSYGMLRMYSTIAELSGIGYGYNVFRTLEKATKWLQIRYEGSAGASNLSPHATG